MDLQAVPKRAKKSPIEAHADGDSVVAGCDSLRARMTSNAHTDSASSATLINPSNSLLIMRNRAARFRTVYAHGASAWMALASMKRVE